MALAACCAFALGRYHEKLPPTAWSHPAPPQAARSHDPYFPSAPIAVHQFSAGSPKLYHRRARNFTSDGVPRRSGGGGGSGAAAACHGAVTFHRERIVWCERPGLSAVAASRGLPPSLLLGADSGQRGALPSGRSAIRVSQSVGRSEIPAHTAGNGRSPSRADAKRAYRVWWGWVDTCRSTASNMYDILHFQKVSVRRIAGWHVQWRNMIVQFTFVCGSAVFRRNFLVAHNGTSRFSSYMTC